MVKTYDFNRFEGMVSQEGYGPPGNWVDHDDYAALLQSHARLLEAMYKIASNDGVGYGHVRIANDAIAAAQPFTET